MEWKDSKKYNNVKVEYIKLDNILNWEWDDEMTYDFEPKINKWLIMALANMSTTEKGEYDPICFIPLCPNEYILGYLEVCLI